MVRYDMNVSEIEEWLKKLTESGKNAENIINEVLHNKGGKMIEESITMLLPTSGRSWVGKNKAAAGAKPFQQDNGNLSVTVRTRSPYNYLYFPDDGTNTKHHIGFRGIPREFMREGVENKTQEIINLCIGSIIEEVENV